MSDFDQPGYQSAPPSTTAPTKSPIASTTIQGAIISVAATMAPVVATLLHTDAPTVNHGVELVVTAVSAVAAVVGFAMTIIGRMKATKPLA